jgi:hypothetical protein
VPYVRDPSAFVIAKFSPYEGGGLGTSLLPIPGLIDGIDQFSIQKWAIFCKFNEIGGIARRQTVLNAAQAIPDPVTPRRD